MYAKEYLKTKQVLDNANLDYSDFECETFKAHSLWANPVFDKYRNPVIDLATYNANRKRTKEKINQTIKLLISNQDGLDRSIIYQLITQRANGFHQFYGDAHPYSAKNVVSFKEELYTNDTQTNNILHILTEHMSKTYPDPNKIHPKSISLPESMSLEDLKILRTACDTLRQKLNDIYDRYNTGDDEYLYDNLYHMENLIEQIEWNHRQNT